MNKKIKLITTIITLVFFVLLIICIVKINIKSNKLLENKQAILYNEGTANKPLLFEGMKAISFKEENGEPIILSDDELVEGIWYNYEEQNGSTENGGTSKWANAMTQDGSMWVWIPRFAYKIEWNGEDQFENIDIVFLNGNTNYSMDGKDVISLDYKVHPAFKDGRKNHYSNGEWDEEITGIWVSKFEAGFAGQKNTSSENVKIQNSSEKYTLEGTNLLGDISEETYITYPVFMGKCYSYNNINVGEMYSLSLKLNEQGNPYGFNENTKTHMLKNSEWGAVTYLAHSKYGRNGTKVSINNMNATKAVPTTSTVTGYAGKDADSIENIVEKIEETLKDSYNDKSYAWYTAKGALGSTTGNIYGIYDMVGGCSEYMAGFLKSINTDISYYYATSILKNEVGSKYCTIFNPIKNDSVYEGNKSIYGDATKETSQKESGYNSWFNETSFYINAEAGFFLRGGEYDRGNYAGLFCYTNHSGHSYESYGFRCALIEK